jgi:hypothetical protein
MEIASYSFCVGNSARQLQIFSCFVECLYFIGTCRILGFLLLLVQSNGGA